jgi:transcriptional regulator with XRE-family HTH domain
MTDIRQEELKDAAVSEETSNQSAEILQRGLGRRIADLRMAKAWSRIDLAGELGVSRDRLAKWERGENVPPLDVLVALRRALGVSIDELITGEPAAESLLSPGQLSPEQREELRRVMEAMERLLGGITDLPTGVEAQGEKT